jgi:O-antigen ligase
MNLKVKNYIIWGFFFLYPLSAAHLRTYDFGFVQLDAFRIYVVLPILYLLHLFLRNRKIRISKESSLMFFYVVFLVFNSFRVNYLQVAEVLNYALPVLFIIVFENLDYEEADFPRFYRMLFLLTAAVFAVSLYQKFIDPNFYLGEKRVDRYGIKYIAFGNTYRNSSLFGAIDFYQAGIAIGMLCLIFMYLNFERIQPRYLALCFMMLISVFFTYTRSTWMIPLIGFILFVHFKPWKKKVGLILLLMVGGLIFYFKFMPSLQQSEMYEERVTTETYESRFRRIELYVENFLGRKMVIGFGKDSGAEFRDLGYGEVHNGFLEVLFRNGLVGMFLYFGFWYYVFKRSRLIYKHTGNGVFIAFVVVFLASNFIYKFINMGHYGYLLMLFYMNMYYHVYVKNKTVEAREPAHAVPTDGEPKGRLVHE